jgi:YVTN family beta-propeller protein
VSADGKRAYVANSKSANVSVLDLDRRLALGNIGWGTSPDWREVRLTPTVGQ